MTGIAKKVPILVYHRVHKNVDSNIPKVIAGQYCGHVTLSRFKKNMALLAAEGFSIVTHEQIQKWLLENKDLPAGKVAAIDFDDNRLNVLENAFPVMEEYGFKGTMFVITQLADRRLRHMQSYPALNWDQLRTLTKSGWTIGSHTSTHAYLADIYTQPNGASKVEQELRQSRQTIEKRLNIKIHNFAYPAGSWDKRIEKSVKRFYRTARLWNCNSVAEYNTVETNPYRLVGTNVSMLTSDEDFMAILAGATE